MPAQLPHINFLMLSHLLRIFHEQKILQKVFGEWREEWWVSQKLCVRADCHYRLAFMSNHFMLVEIQILQCQTIIQCLVSVPKE